MSELKMRAVPMVVGYGRDAGRLVRIEVLDGGERIDLFSPSIWGPVYGAPPADHEAIREAWLKERISAAGKQFESALARRDDEGMTLALDEISRLISLLPERVSVRENVRTEGNNAAKP